MRDFHSHLDADDQILSEFRLNFEVNLQRIMDGVGACSGDWNP